MFNRKSHEVKSASSSMLARSTAKATIARVMVVLVVAGGVGVMASSKADAAVGPYHTLASPSLAERSGASTSTTAVGSLPYNSSVMINCQTAGVAYGTGGSPATDTIWDQLSNNTYVADYWVKETAVGTFTPSIPRCGVLLENAHSGLCLDSNGSATGPRMHQWSCSGTNPNQEYAMQYTGYKNWYTIKNIAYNECVDVPGGSTQNGVQLQLYPCNSTDGAQWFQEISGGQLVNWNSGKCVDVYDWSTQNGGTIDQWTCQYSQSANGAIGPQANQTWIQAVP